ncbi:MAG: sensor histidine kinase, partial [Opitutales bacterium]
LSNAIRFAPNHSTVVLGAREEAGLLRVWVDDAGPGVRVSEQPGLFVARRRAGKDGSLSLYDCRRVVQAHHGLITMHNRNPQGARFEFFMPALSEHEATGEHADFGTTTARAESKVA